MWNNEGSTKLRPNWLEKQQKEKKSVGSKVLLTNAKISFLLAL